VSSHQHAIRLDEWMAQKAAQRARRRRNRVLWRWSLAAVLALAWLLVLTRSSAHAQARYTSDDTIAAIDEASAEIGVSWTWLYSAVRCETAGSFDPYSVGRQGELGPAQLHPRGELQRFYAWGYLDPFSPYQSIRFMAQRFAMGGASAWSCAR
jgi:hypothetical protein